jgi:hypothetical protein
MNLIAKIQNGIDNLFLPKDQLTDQAKGIVEHWDSDGDGVIDVKALAASTAQLPPDDINRVAAAGLFDADAQRNGNGYATVKEVRKVLEQFDVNGAEGTGDKVLDGVELLALIAHYRDVGTTGERPVPPAAQTGVSQADQGAEQLAA